MGVLGCLQAVITLWGCKRKYRLGWYQVDLPPPARSGGGQGGGTMAGSLVVRFAVSICIVQFNVQMYVQ